MQNVAVIRDLRAAQLAIAQDERLQKRERARAVGNRMEDFQRNPMRIIQHAEHIIAPVDAHHLTGIILLFRDFGTLIDVLEIVPEEALFQRHLKRRKPIQNIFERALEQLGIDRLSHDDRHAEYGVPARIARRRINLGGVVQSEPIFLEHCILHIDTPAAPLY